MLRIYIETFDGSNFISNIYIVRLCLLNFKTMHNFDPVKFCLSYVQEINRQYYLHEYFIAILIQIFTKFVIWDTKEKLFIIMILIVNQNYYEI